MNIKNAPEFRQFTSHPKWFSIRGGIMMLLSIAITSLCIMAPNVYLLSESFSWLPIVAMILLAVGFLRCLDATLSITKQGFLLNMHGGVLDVVVGGLILFSVSSQPDRVIYLIAGYLFNQGILRNILLSVVTIRNPLSNRITGLVSILMGFLIWFEWPSVAPWFLALSLSVDIGFRGWALIMLASSIKAEPEGDH
jgi:uncharacterized membrane protein HdeD (DUF308 family)